MVYPRIKQVRHVKDYILHLQFTNGEKGDIDLRDRIVDRGGVFAPLENIDYFARVAVDPEIHTLVWPNGVDLHLDVLYREVTGAPLPALFAF